MEKSPKVYVEVTAVFDPEGNLRPQFIRWEDGTVYEIDRVLHVCRAASLKAGGAGIRYTVRIQNRETYLFLEETAGLWSGEWINNTEPTSGYTEKYIIPSSRGKALHYKNLCSNNSV